MHDAVLHQGWHIAGMLEPHAAALAYIRFVLESLDITPTALAKLAGISATTLTRPLNNPEHKFVISTSTIGKIAAASEINPAPFFESEDIATRHIKVFRQDVETLGNVKTRSPRKKHPETLLTAGVVNTGEWAPNEIVNPFHYMPMFLTHTWYRFEDIFGISVVDDKANMVAQPGEVLLCVKISALTKPIHPSAIYILQRLADGGHLVEISACYSQKTDTGWILRPASYAIDSSVSFSLENLEAQTGDMRVIGVVQYVVREPFPLA